MKTIQFILISLISIFFICFNCFAANEIQGEWGIKEVIANPVPENLVFLPKNIKIEFTGEDEGKLRIQWHEEETADETYVFSTGSTTFTVKTIRVFDTGTKKSYLRREVRVFYSKSKGTFTFHLTKSITDTEEGTEGIFAGYSSYLIHLHGEDLVFTHSERSRIFKALYVLKEK